MIYLDNAATTKISEEVMEAMLPYFSDVYGNPGSIHSMGRQASRAVEQAREQVAAPIGANAEQIIFTSGGSEANTLAIAGLAEHLKAVGKTHIITSQVEHHSVINAIKYLFDSGFNVTWIPVEGDGSISLDKIYDAICPETGFISIMAVNNETGNWYNIRRIGEMCYKHSILFHTDCVQAYCGMHIDVNTDHIDFLSASGHKIHAPKGIGFLYAREKTLLRPIIFGGSQENGLRGGTHNVPYIVGMGRAAELAHQAHQRNSFCYGRKTERVMFRILSEVTGSHINGVPFGNSKTVNIRFDGVDGETLLLMLDSKGIEVSAGSACSAHYAVPSHVLTAIGLTDDEARSSVRISVSMYTTDEEIDEAVNAIADSVMQLRGG